jgi:phenylpyruvate tautomerase PptA (4-oxalocrotonate tautomerase family)
MPYLHVDLPLAPGSVDRAGLAERIARRYAEVMETNADRVTVGLRELGDQGVLRLTADGMRPAIVVQCDVRRGRPQDHRRRMGDALAALLEEELGWPAERVVVHFTQHAADEIYRDRHLVEEWSPDEAATPR